MDSNDKRIAKNATMLYLRMFLSVLVGLYTSRVVLDVLGVEDYGIYGLVGSVVAMMSFIQTAMSGATSRFITYELGQGNRHRLAITFSSALIIHFGISIIIFIFGETIGLWFFYNKLVIPESRISSAFWVYQLSIASAMIGVTQVPYGAVIMSHEKMDIYAYFELLNVFLKLGIVYLLLIGNFDKLILYALLTFTLSLFMRLFYRVYCIRHFEESRFHFVWDWNILKPLLSFSGWDLYGNMCVVTNRQGTNFLINMFFGVVYNAASSVATTIHGSILGFSTVISIAYKPQIIKNYAKKQYCKMQEIMSNSLKFTLILYSSMAVPAFIEVDMILDLWLKTVPDYASVFCRFMIVTSVLNFANNIALSAIHATGNIKRISFYTGSIYLFSIPVMYIILLIWNVHPETVYIVTLITWGCILISNLIIMKKQIPMLSPWILAKNLVCGLFYPLMALLVYLPFYYMFSTGVIRLVATCTVFPLLLFFITYAFALDQETKATFKRYLWSKMSFLRFL